MSLPDVGLEKGARVNSKAVPASTGSDKVILMVLSTLYEHVKAYWDGDSHLDSGNSGSFTSSVSGIPSVR